VTASVTRRPKPPGALGWRMPAEWAPHEAVWLAWPHHRADWPGKFAAIPWVYAEIVRHLHTSEHVNLLVQDAAMAARVRRILKAAAVDLERVRFFPAPTDRVWTRDYGPIFVVSPGGDVGLTHWRFNAWAKYDNWHNDVKAPRIVNRRLKLPAWQPEHEGRRVVLEGGSIDVNGQGLLLTTEECLLSPVQARNPGMTRAQLEGVFADYLGIKKTLWLGKGIAGDDTHGHIDDLARFVGPNTIATVVEKDARDDNYVPLRENLERLQALTDAEGHGFQIVELPMPAPLYFRGQRLPASYANFYIANDKVLVPTFNDPHDRTALGILADLFPDRPIVGIHAVDLVWGFGTLHCLTQQQPRAKIAP
jgi:agmatine deiminase